MLWELKIGAFVPVLGSGHIRAQTCRLLGMCVLWQGGGGGGEGQNIVP